MTEGKKECIKLWRTYLLCNNDNVVIYIRGTRGGYERGKIVSVSEYAVLIEDDKGKRKAIRLSEIKMVEEE